MGLAVWDKAKPATARPYLDAAAVTPNDGADLPRSPALGLFVGTGGAVVVVTVQGSTVTLGNVPSGTTLALAVTRVKSGGTGASNIVALY